MIDPEDVLSRVREAIIVLDGSKRILAWLGGAPKLLGYTGEEMKGADIDSVLEPLDANDNSCCIGPADPKSILRVVRGSPEQELLIATKNGSRVWVGVTSAYERNSKGEIDRIILVARNISRRRRIDQVKSDVISAVSHELRSPLTSVKGFVSTLVQKWDRLTEEQKRHFLATIQVDADRVTRLINELLDISRLEAGRLLLRRELTQLPEIVAKVVDRISPQTDRHQIQLELNGTLPSVFADPDKVEQVLTNLVENAVKYTDSGHITVSCSADEGAVRVSVVDEGEGIPLEHRQHVFGKFFRRGDRASAPSGTGLGLYISKGLIEAHGGKIWVEDGSDGGAAFIFTLPLTKS